MSHTRMAYVDRVEELEKENAGLREYILNLIPYCDNCEHDNTQDGACDFCNRKSFNWSHRKGVEL